ncbi:uncharacterized protein BDV17DRAFT_280097 [Aspergillus undulatus]|uniref:uncharacterized protein n=1 Tax=Aspergillus undulatus TaxID=1810928 RepID=UPI003CCE1171
MAQSPVNIASDKHEIDSELWTTPSIATKNSTIPPSNLPHRQPETGTSVLIVSAGRPVYSGDIIIRPLPVVAMIRQWPDMGRDMAEEQVNAVISHETHDIDSSTHLAARKGPLAAPAKLRRRLYRILMRQVLEVQDTGKFGVMLEPEGIDSIRLADIVAAADGLKFPSDILIANETEPVPTAQSSAGRVSTTRHKDPDDLARAMFRAAGWAPATVALIRSAQNGVIVQWPLLWRNLRRELTSSAGHVVQSIYNSLRYERVSCARKISFVNSQLKTED